MQFQFSRCHLRLCIKGENCGFVASRMEIAIVKMPKNVVISGSINSNHMQNRHIHFSYSGETHSFSSTDRRRKIKPPPHAIGYQSSCIMNTWHTLKSFFAISLRFHFRYIFLHFFSFGDMCYPITSNTMRVAVLMNVFRVLVTVL